MEDGWIRARGAASASELIGEPSDTGIYLYWLPLGAGGSFVRFNGRVFEFIQARVERRIPLALYHTALVVVVPEGRFVIENSWPIPDAEGPSRGVTVEGPVFMRRLGRLEVFRYEVRCWRDGVIADQADAVESPQCVSRDPIQALRILELVDSVPSLVWGRDEQSTGDMWNSNSVISYPLARSGVPTEPIPSCRWKGSRMASGPGHGIPLSGPAVRKSP